MCLLYTIDQDTMHFAFTYPYSYATVQAELEAYDAQHQHTHTHTNTSSTNTSNHDPDGIFYQREVGTRSRCITLIDTIIHHILTNYTNDAYILHTYR
jgi:hypothetical protein